MKAVINGVEVEGTPEEIAFLTKSKTTTQDVQKLERPKYLQTIVNPEVYKVVSNKVKHLQMTMSKYLLKLILQDIDDTNNARAPLYVPRTERFSRNNKNWRPEEDTLLIQLRKSGASWLAIGKQLNRGKNACFQRAWKLSKNTILSGKEPNGTFITTQRRNDAWSVGEDNTLRELAKPDIRLDWKAIIRALPGRTKTSIRGRMQTLGLGNAHRSRRLPSGHSRSVSDVERVRLTETMRFISHRAKYYVGQFGWSYEKARIQAGEDYRNKARSIGSAPAQQVHSPIVQDAIASTNKQITDSILDKDQTIITITPKMAPTLSCLHAYSQKILLTLLEHAVKSGKEITLPVIQTTLIFNTNAGTGAVWDNERWQTFLRELLEKSEQFAQYLGVPNKFKIKQNNGAETFAYE